MSQRLPRSIVSTGAVDGSMDPNRRIVPSMTSTLTVWSLPGSRPFRRMNLNDRADQDLRLVSGKLMSLSADTVPRASNDDRVQKRPGDPASTGGPQHAEVGDAAAFGGVDNGPGRRRPAKSHKLVAVRKSLQVGCVDSL